MLSQWVVLTIKHGVVNVMNWGCFGANKVQNLFKTSGILRVYSTTRKEHYWQKLCVYAWEWPQAKCKSVSQLFKRIRGQQCRQPHSPNLTRMKLLENKIHLEKTKCQKFNKQLRSYLQDVWKEIQEDCSIIELQSFSSYRIQCPNTYARYYIYNEYNNMDYCWVTWHKWKLT